MTSRVSFASRCLAISALWCACSGNSIKAGDAGWTPNEAGPTATPDATETALVHGWLTTNTSGLPDWQYATIATNFPGDKLTTLVDTIVLSCTEFAPSEPNWQRDCEALITSAIVAESSYNPKSLSLDSYGTRNVNGTTANDPVVGLLQIRFSSVVQNFNYYGPMSKLTAIGCNWPTSLTASTPKDDVWWATQGGVTYVSFMEDPTCNVALATWAYFVGATGNGGSDAIYTYQYCQGQGIAGNMVVGLLSFLEGDGFPRPADATNSYVTGIKGRFASLLGGLPSPDPFADVLVPETAKYCK